jgi:hypothetical protein
LVGGPGSSQGRRQRAGNHATHRRKAPSRTFVGSKVNYLKFDEGAKLLNAFDDLAAEIEPESVIRAQTLREGDDGGS